MLLYVSHWGCNFHVSPWLKSCSCFTNCSLTLSLSLTRWPPCYEPSFYDSLWQHGSRYLWPAVGPHWPEAESRQPDRPAGQDHQHGGGEYHSGEIYTRQQELLNTFSALKQYAVNSDHCNISRQQHKRLFSKQQWWLQWWQAEAIYFSWREGEQAFGCWLGSQTAAIKSRGNVFLKLRAHILVVRHMQFLCRAPTLAVCPSWWRNTYALKARSIFSSEGWCRHRVTCNRLTSVFSVTCWALKYQTILHKSQSVWHASATSFYCFEVLQTPDH